MSDVVTGDFLSPELKKLKADIIDDMLEAFFNSIYKNIHKLNHQSVTDLHIAIMITVTRELLVNLLLNSGIINRKEILKSILQTIKEEVNKQIKLRTN